MQMGRWLIGISAGLTALGHAETPKSLLVGQHKLDQAALSKLIRGTGKIVRRDEKGFYLVAPLAGTKVDQLSKSLKKAKIKFVLPGDADRVEKDNLNSVKEHIEYLEGSYCIKTGKMPGKDDEETLGVDFYEALRFYLETRVDQNGELSRDAYIQAVNHRDQMPPVTPNMMDPGAIRDKQNLSPSTWAYAGPHNLDIPYQTYYGQRPLSGRKNGIAVSPSNYQISYLASAGGGIWKSTDNAITYQPMSDSWKFLHTTCVAVHPTDPDIVYAGTGDFYGFFTRQTFGIMKSINGGVTWSNVGNADFGDSVVTRIKISKNNPNILVALTAGPTGDIWRSTDAGATWARTNAPDGDWEDIDASGSDITWVAVSAASGGRIYRSTDQGATWASITKPAGAAGSIWDVAVSKLDFNRWYLVCSNRKVYSSTNSGSTWTDRTAAHDAAASDPTYNWSQSTYDIYVEAGHTETTDIVYVGLITISASDNNGTSWTDIARSFESNSRWHNDQHCLNVVEGAGNGRWAFAGGDGGVTFLNYNETTNSASWTPLNKTIHDTQFYKIAVHPTNSVFVMGGTQDNASPAGRGAGAAGNWANLNAGDGAGCAFDINNPAIHYTGSQNGGVFQYTSDFDTTATNISPGGGIFIAPLVCAGSTPVFGASNGNLRKYIAGAWTNNATGGGAIRTIAKSGFSANKLYTGATNGDMYRTANLGTSFTKIDNTLPNRAIGGMAESPFTSDYLVVGLQGAGNPDGVYRSANVNVAAPTWTNISGSGLTAIPSMPVNDIERDPFNVNIYYAATDIGVFMTPDAGSHWYNMNSMGLPNVHVNDLWVYSNAGVNYLYAGTFGRGIWRSYLSSRYVSSVVIAKPAIYGGQTNTVTVKLNGSAPVGCLVNVSDSSSNVSVPTPVTVPQGSTQATFTIYTTNPAATQNVTVYASVFGGTSATSTFTLHRVPPFTYTAASDAVYGGSSFSATVDLHMAAPIATTVSFSDSSASVGSPASTSIAAGSSVKSVSLTTASVASTVNATINAKISSVTATDTIRVEPRPTLTTFLVAPNPVKGGLPTVGKLTLDFAGQAGPLTATCSDTSTLVTTPLFIIIPGGSSSQSFNITTAAVRANTYVSITVKMGTVSKTERLLLTP